MGGAATLPQLKQPTCQTLSSHTQPRDGDRPYGGRSNPFPKGSIVEVRPDEQDFKNTYFSATVISSAVVNSISPKKSSKKTSPRKVKVRYKDLLASNDRSTRLKELVDISCVRPCPPLEEIVEGYGPGDVVDAFYLDGWWIGVVERAVEGEERRYLVSFQNPTDEREFSFSELRVHWDWVDESWVRPDLQSITGLMFDVGRKVEVSFDRKDCQGAWFPATIQQDNGNGSYLVKYSAITDNEVQTLEATVDSLHLRPSPPLLKDKNFVLLEKVDASFDCGWWSGVIRKELENSSYLVFFKQLNRQKEFNQSALRPHMDWKDGKWFTSSQLSQDVSTPPSESGNVENCTGENLRASVLTDPAKSLGDEKTSPEKRTRRKQRHAGGKNNSLPSKVKNSNAEVSQVKNPKPNVEGTELVIVDKTAEAVQNEHTKQGLEIPVIIGLPCAEMASAGFGQSRGNKRGRGSISMEITNTDTEDNSTAQKIKDATLSEIMEFGEKRKRGRPRRQTPVTDDLNKTDDDPRKTPEAEAVGVENSAVIVLEAPESIVMKTPESIVLGTPEVMVKETSPRNQEKTTLNKDKPINGRSDINDRKRTARRIEKKVAKENTPQESLTVKRGRRRSTPIVEDQDSLGSPVSKSANTNSALQFRIPCEAPGNEFDDQPLSKWFEGMHNPSTIDNSKPSAVGQSIENGEKQKDIASDKHQESETPILALTDTFSAVPLEQPSLPFVKNNLLWKTIEQTMDVFQRMPQNPHFQPLQNVNECLREGFAIGHMVTFSSVVEKASNLRIDTPKSITDDLLETLATLGTHGFTVRPIQDRVAEFIMEKEKEAKLVQDAKLFRHQQLEHEYKRDMFDVEIDRINEEIRELQEKLMVVESAKVKEISEIAGLEAKLKETEVGIQNARRNLEVVVSMPL